MYIRIIQIVILVILPYLCLSQNKINVIPQPVSVKITSGSFILDSSVLIIAVTTESATSAQLFNDYLFQFYGFKLKIETENLFAKSSIVLNVQKTDKQGFHKIIIGEKNILIEGDEPGIFYAFQTLKQLIKLEKNKNILLPCLEITDYPRYNWRGMHLDVSRHFISKDSVEKYIDYLSFYKMNTFHWHLTDDQGWRIEIKKYPKLTQVGGFRNGTLIGAYSETPQCFDTIRYGGFYTQEEIKEIVDYAAKRQVTIVPEIEMPGHAMAAITAYPEYSCTGGSFETAKLWGVFDDVFCAKEETFQFIQDVLSEVMDLFPGKYIHVGGDECPKTRWRTCPRCQEIIKKENLKNESELQSYFITRVGKMINARDKKMIGWDEILEGGLAPNAAVMSWRGIDGGIEAVKLRHFVVMTPGSYCYFDHYQGSPKSEPLAFGGYTPVEKVYSYEPTPAILNTDEQKYILGAQGNVWTEYMPNFRQVEYMIFPRMCALSEVLWSPQEVRNWDNFRDRLMSHFLILEMMHVNYSKAMFEVSTIVKPANDGILVDLSTSFPNLDIRFTTDQSNLSSNSIKYEKSILINTNTTIKAASFNEDRCKSAVLEQSFVISKSTGKKVVLATEPSENYNTGGAFTLVDGVVARIPWYGKEWLGFSGKDLDATIDLEKIDLVQEILVGVLSAESSWIYLPQSVEVFTSIDGISFISVKKIDSIEIAKFNRLLKVSFDPVEAKYVKVVVKNSGIIPDGKPGANNNAWLFVDEIQIR